MRDNADNCLPEVIAHALNLLLSPQPFIEQVETGKI